MTERNKQLIDLIDELSLIKERLTSQLPVRRRPAFKNIVLTQRGTLILGPRGTGKSTFLIQKANEMNLFYLSADSPLCQPYRLWDLGVAIFSQGYSGVIFDEVHFAANWSRDLKALYDAYPNKKIIASDSSKVILQKGLADLSRRFIKIPFSLLSFTEFIWLKYEIELPTLDPLKLKTKQILEITQEHPTLLNWFKEYIQEGMRPFFLEGEYQQKQFNIIEKTIFSDLPFILPQTTQSILRLGSALIGTIAHATIPTVNVDSTCRDWSIGKETFYNLLSALEKLGLLNVIDFNKTTKVRTKGAKLFLADPSQYLALKGNLGNVREAYVAFALNERFGEVYANKDETMGDFISNGVTFEVGGRSKKQKKSDYVIADNLELHSPNKIPLWTLGLY